MVLLVAALLLSRRRRWLVSGALAVLGVLSIGLVEQLLRRSIESPWTRSVVSAAPEAQAIVVLIGGPADRFLTGVALFEAGRAPRLLFTGGQSPYQRGVGSRRRAVFAGWRSVWCARQCDGIDADGARRRRA